MRNHKSPVLALALAEDLYLASGAKNGVTLITNIISGEVIHSLKGHSGSVTALTITEIERYALVTFIISQYNFCFVYLLVLPAKQHLEYQPSCLQLQQANTSIF